MSVKNYERTSNGLSLRYETLTKSEIEESIKYIPHFPSAISGIAAVETSPYTSAHWDATCDEVTSLYDGMMVIIRVPVAGNSTYGVGLKINNGIYHPVVYNISSTVGTRYGVNSTIVAIYNANQSANLYSNSASSTSVTGVWQVYDYDSDTDTTYRLRNSSAIYVNKSGQSTNRRTLLFEVAGGLSCVNTAIATGTTKVPINFKYIPGGQIRYYSVSGAIAADANFSASGLWEQYAIDIRYSFNTGSTLVEGNPVYIRMIVNSDGTLSQDASSSGDNPIVQALPNTVDNKVYVYLGRAGGTSTLELEPIHPIYEYKDGAIRLRTNAVASGGTTTDVQVNGTSVTSNGVANLITNTAYNSSSNKIATMSDIPANVVQADNTLTDTYVTIGKGNKKIATTGVQIDSSNNVFIPGVTKFNSGSASGCAIFGGNVGSTGYTANTRKLARLTAPNYESAGTNFVSIVSVDCNALNVNSTAAGNGNGLEFGGRTGDTTTYGADYISFSVAKAHNNTDKNNIAQFLPNKIQLFNHESGSTDITANPRYNGLIGMWEFNNNNTFKNNSYTYTLPNATGTIALTSDLSSFITSVDWSDINNKPTFGTAAAKDYTTSVTSGSSDLVTSGAVFSAIDALPEPMVFKGSVGTNGTVTWANLPAAASTNEGHTYKVITDHTSTPICKVGDTIISNGSEWIVIPSGDEPSGTVTSVGLSVPTGLSISGSPITSSGTLTVSYASGYSIPTTSKQSEWDNKQSALTTSSVNDGTISKVIGFDSSGNIVKAAQSGGGSSYTAGLGISISNGVISNNGVTYTTTAPSAANTDGDLKFVVLSSEPSTRYAGYFYIVTSGTDIALTNNEIDTLWTNN